jgi:hypothetical protein
VTDRRSLSLNVFGELADALLYARSCRETVVSSAVAVLSWSYVLLELRLSPFGFSWALRSPFVISINGLVWLL